MSSHYTGRGWKPRLISFGGAVTSKKRRTQGHGLYRDCRVLSLIEISAEPGNYRFGVVPIALPFPQNVETEGSFPQISRPPPTPPPYIGTSSDQVQVRIRFTNKINLKLKGSGPCKASLSLRCDKSFPSCNFLECCNLLGLKTEGAHSQARRRRKK